MTTVGRVESPGCKVKVTRDTGGRSQRLHAPCCLDRFQGWCCSASRGNHDVELGQLRGNEKQRQKSSSLSLQARPGEFRGTHRHTRSVTCVLEIKCY